MTLTVVAPTDAQLGYIAALCEEKGYPPCAVYSKQHASLLIEEMRSGTDPRYQELLDAGERDDGAETMERLEHFLAAWGVRVSD